MVAYMHCTGSKGMALQSMSRYVKAFGWSVSVVCMAQMAQMAKMAAQTRFPIPISMSAILYTFFIRAAE